MNRIVTIGPSANVYAVARVLASFVAHLDAEARGKFDAAAAARLLMVAHVDQGTLITPEGDALLSELLGHLTRVQSARTPTAKGGAA